MALRGAFPHSGLEGSFEKCSKQEMTKVSMTDAGLDLRKGSAGVLKVGSRVRHRLNAKLGTIKYAGGPVGRSVAVVFDDQSMAVCEAQDLHLL